MTEHTLENVDRGRVRIIAISWAGTLFNELRGMQTTLTGLVRSEGGHLDVEAMALVWRKEIWRRSQGKYLPWCEVACFALDRTFRAHGLSPPNLDPYDIQNEVLAWPMFNDHAQLGLLGRRLRLAILSQQDAPTIGPCLRGLSRACDRLVSSDLSRAYKPNTAYFKLLRPQLDIEEPVEALVISTDSFTDLDPARSEGFQTVLIRLTHDEDDDEDNDKDETAALPTLADVVRRLG